MLARDLNEAETCIIRYKITRFLTTDNKLIKCWRNKVQIKKKYYVGSSSGIRIIIRSKLELKPHNTINTLTGK